MSLRAEANLSLVQAAGPGKRYFQVLALLKAVLLPFSGPTPVFYLRQRVDECTKIGPAVAE